MCGLAGSYLYFPFSLTNSNTPFLHFFPFARVPACGLHAQCSKWLSMVLIASVHTLLQSNSPLHLVAVLCCLDELRKVTSSCLTHDAGGALKLKATWICSELELHLEQNEHVGQLSDEFVSIIQVNRFFCREGHHLNFDC